MTLPEFRALLGPRAPSSDEDMARMLDEWTAMARQVVREFQRRRRMRGMETGVNSPPGVAA